MGNGYSRAGGRCEFRAQGCKIIRPGEPKVAAAGQGCGGGGGNVGEEVLETESKKTEGWRLASLFYIGKSGDRHSTTKSIGLKHLKSDFKRGNRPKRRPGLSLLQEKRCRGRVLSHHRAVH